MPANGSVDCSYSVTPGDAGGEQHRHGDVGLGRLGEREATIQWAAPTEVGVPCDGEDGGQIDETLDLADLTQRRVDDDVRRAWTCKSGTASPSSGRTNTATVTWDGGTDSDSASVQVGCGTTPPPIPPVTPPVTPPTDELMDVQVVKDATPQVQLVNGQADVAYTVRVKNNGPNQAHNVDRRGRGAERRHVPRGHAAAGERQLLDQRPAPCCSAASARSAPVSSG